MYNSSKSPEPGSLCYTCVALCIRDSEIRMRCGPDASLYLALHRYLIVLLCVFTFLSLVIVLPVNYSSGDRGVFY